jgi:ubiquinol-cytochrome c reductase cytochrome b subunit
MGGSIAVLALIPFINSSETRNTTYRPIFKIFYWMLVSDFFLLMWIGQKPVENVYTLAGQILTVYYFVFFLIIIGMVGKLESKLVYFKHKYE